MEVFVMKVEKWSELNLLHEELLEVIDWHESMKNSYFWTGYSSASLRRNWEQRNNKELSFTYDKKHYYIAQNASMTCKNVYTSLTVEVDEEKKDVRAIKKVIKALEKELSEGFSEEELAEHLKHFQ